ncbi:MAG TPA: helix-turn-helix transcriptional regulator [Trebonia sp.]
MNARGKTANQVLSDNMTRLRRAERMGRQELADRMGWSLTTLFNAEQAANGGHGLRNRMFSVEDLFLIAGVFRVPPLSLLALPGQCPSCLDTPPRGLRCQTCGAEGARVRCGNCSDSPAAGHDCMICGRNGAPGWTARCAA